MSPKESDCARLAVSKPTTVYGTLFALSGRCVVIPGRPPLSTEVVSVVKKDGAAAAQATPHRSAPRRPSALQSSPRPPLGKVARAQSPKRASRTEPYDAESLLEVAVAVFTERGYDGTSMEHLAQAAGITKSAFYHHVDGKEDLLRLSLDRALDALFAVLDEPEGERLRAIDRLEQVVRESIRVLVEELPHVTLLLRVRGNTPLEREALERRREFDSAIRKLVHEVVVDGDFAPSTDERVTSQLIFGMVNSIAEWYSPSGPLTMEDLAEIVVLMVIPGLRGAGSGIAALEGQSLADGFSRTDGVALGDGHRTHDGKTAALVTRP